MIRSLPARYAAVLPVLLILTVVQTSLDRLRRLPSSVIHDRSSSSGSDSDVSLLVSSSSGSNDTVTSLHQESDEHKTPSPEWIHEHFPDLSDDFCQQRSPKDIPRVYLGNEQFRLYHIGKAAGGTVNTRLKSGFKIHYEQCHPNPTECFEEDKDIPTDQQYRFLTIRDPIDRYVASFEFGLSTVCQPGETEKCRPSLTEREARVYDLYHENPSLLGEALCDPEAGYALNQTVIENDLVQLKHLKADNMIHRWLGEHVKELYDWRKSPEFIYPLVVEKPYDVVRMVDEAVYDLADITKGKLPSESNKIRKDPIMYSYAGDMELLPLRQYHADCMLSDKASHKHSSAAKRGRPDLSEHAQLCLARYYQRDYELLPELKNLSCKSSYCHGALQSIIDRRSHLLEKLRS
jgi:hypothetical protein